MDQYNTALKLPSRFQNETFNLAISLVCAPLNFLESHAKHYLSVDEKIYLDTIFSSKNRYNYLLGRYAAKIAIKEIYCNIKFQDVTISSGIFGQPLVVSKEIPMLDLTLAHTGSIGVSLVGPYGCPLGIDVEELKASNFDEIMALSSNKEIFDVKSVYKEDSLKSAIRLWVVKEALSKTIKCGFTLPLNFYEVSSVLNANGQNCFLFVNFPQYRGYVCNYNNIYYGFAAPKSLEIDNEIIKFSEKVATVCKNMS